MKESVVRQTKTWLAYLFLLASIVFAATLLWTRAARRGESPILATEETASAQPMDSLTVSAPRNTARIVC